MGGAFFAIPIIGSKLLDGYREKPLHPSYDASIGVHFEAFFAQTARQY
jgi:hypothetical protein